MSEKIKNFIHSKTFLIILIIVLILSVITAGVYAWLTWSSSNKTNLTMRIGKIADVTFPSGPEINTSSLTPVFNYTDGEKITFSIYNKSTTSATINYKVVFNITTLPDALKDESFKYVLVKVDTSSASNDKVVKEGTLKDYSSGSSITLVEDTLTDITADYAFYVYIDANIESSNDMVGKTFVGNITVSAEEKQEVDSPAYETIKLLNLQGSIKNDTPDFSTVSGNNGEAYVDGNLDSTTAGDGTVGIYKAEDDLGTSYYFRGAVENNYVYFANNYWRIIRINGDGTVRIIFAGTNAFANGENDAGTLTTLGSSQYATDGSDNGYVGYMHGSFTPPSTSYEEAHTPSVDSEIKSRIDAWFAEDISSAGYADYVADSIFCNDRAADGYEAYGNNYVEYNGFRRMQNSTPSLKCNASDRFIVGKLIENSTILEASVSLTFPVGLITADEALFAGMTSRIPNSTGQTDTYYLSKDNYLYNGWGFWTMTPSTSISMFAFATEEGILEDISLEDIDTQVRPVLSLLQGVLTSGSGTIDDPFTIM